MMLAWRDIMLAWRDIMLAWRDIMLVWRDIMLAWRDCKNIWELKDYLWNWTNVISSHPPLVEWHVRFTVRTLKPLSGPGRRRYPRFSSWKYKFITWFEWCLIVLQILNLQFTNGRRQLKLRVQSFKKK